MHKADAHDLDPTRAPSVFDIDVLRLARVYAAALLKAAEPKGQVDEIQQSFDTLVGNRFQIPPHFREAFQHLLEVVGSNTHEFEMVKRGTGGGSWAPSQ